MAADKRIADVTTATKPVRLCYPWQSGLRRGNVGAEMFKVHLAGS
jgi:hypothetical protein